MFAVCTIGLLFLISLSHSALNDCDGVVQPLTELDPRQFEGRWALVAGSIKIIEPERPLQASDSHYCSVTIEFYNRTFVKASRLGDTCSYLTSNITLEGHNYNFTKGIANFNGTFFHTSCVDCGMLTFNVDAPFHKSSEVYLFSRRRKVDDKDIEWFGRQVECLNMPPHFVMDPTKSLCLEENIKT
uniref:Apolipoprotein M n=1 Tax=Mastacembelus armatus TaxID=205130 RepID=A0A7N8YF66_9TELE